MARYHPWLRMYHGYRDRDAAIADFQSNTTRATVSPSRHARARNGNPIHLSKGRKAIKLLVFEIRAECIEPSG